MCDRQTAALYRRCEERRLRETSANHLPGCVGPRPGVKLEVLIEDTIHDERFHETLRGQAAVDAFELVELAARPPCLGR